MIQYKKFMAMMTAATTALVMTVGFNSEAADTSLDTSYMAEHMQVQSFKGLLYSAPEGAVQSTVTAAEAAQEAYEKEQEERKAAEAVRQAKEEAAREAKRIEAEQAAIQEAAAQKAAMAAAGEEELLAALIYCEAGNQPYEGQVAVGAVVMNRVRSGIYPNSITEVIYQSGQFGPAMTGWLDSVASSGGYTDSARQAAAEAVAGSNPIGECLYFDCGGVGYQLGDHFFH